MCCSRHPSSSRIGTAGFLPPPSSAFWLRLWACLFRGWRRRRNGARVHTAIHRRRNAEPRSRPCTTAWCGITDRGGGFAAGNSPRPRETAPISRIGAFSPTTRREKSGSLFSAERGKNFIGEPLRAREAYYYAFALLARWRSLTTRAAVFAPRSDRQRCRVRQLQERLCPARYLDGLATRAQGDGSEALTRRRRLRSATCAYDPRPMQLSSSSGARAREIPTGQYGEQLRSASSRRWCVQPRSPSASRRFISPRGIMEFPGGSRGRPDHGPHLATNVL